MFKYITLLLITQLFAASQYKHDFDSITSVASGDTAYVGIVNLDFKYPIRQIDAIVKATATQNTSISLLLYYYMPDWDNGDSVVYYDGVTANISSADSVSANNLFYVSPRQRYKLYIVNNGSQAISNVNIRVIGW